MGACWYMKGVVDLLPSVLWRDSHSINLSPVDRLPPDDSLLKCS